jgi:hypothetical protein
MPILLVKVNTNNVADGPGQVSATSITCTALAQAF